MHKIDATEAAGSPDQTEVAPAMSPPDTSCELYSGAAAGLVVAAAEWPEILPWMLDIYTRSQRRSSATLRR